MADAQTIYILGAGAVGFPLAAHLTRAGRRAVAVRTSRVDVSQRTVDIVVQNGSQSVRAGVQTVSLSRLSQIEGMVVITAKAHANEAIAHELQEKGAKGPIVIMQNGLGVERPFVEAGFSPIYRCILYVTGQVDSAAHYSFRPVTASAIGVVAGGAADLQSVVEALHTAAFPFRMEANIEREVWKKTIINAIFNSICPLLEVDNGVFARDVAAAALARDVVQECLALTERLALGLEEDELLAQLLQISERSDGQLISTLQDIRAGRQTEMAFLNQEIARVAATLDPPQAVPKTALLGRMVLVKSEL